MVPNGPKLIYLVLRDGCFKGVLEMLGSWAKARRATNAEHCNTVHCPHGHPLIKLSDLQAYDSQAQHLEYQSWYYVVLLKEFHA